MEGWVSGYAGDIGVQDAWARLLADSDAQLIDVRTDAELTFVGFPDLSVLGREPIFVPWQFFPARKNERFVEQLSSELERRRVPRTADLLFLCRSGGRSQSAAIAMTREGYPACLNIAGGFEGGLDAHRHRGTTSGWKVDGLPWAQS